MKRTFWKVDLTSDNYGQEYERRVRVKHPFDGNVISSLLEDGQHAPALDLDVPAELLPSSTVGHSHLYIDVPTSWRRYKRLLRALWKAGIIERGYYRASVARRQTHLRKPGVTK